MCSSANPASAMRNALKSSQKGQEFLKSFDDFMEKEAGWRMERMAEINVPTWLEDPTPAFNVIKMGLEKGIDYNLDEERKEASRPKGWPPKKRCWRRLRPSRGDGSRRS